MTVSCEQNNEPSGSVIRRGISCLPELLLASQGVHSMESTQFCAILVQYLSSYTQIVRVNMKIPCVNDRQPQV